MKKIIHRVEVSGQTVCGLKKWKNGVNIHFAPRWAIDTINCTKCLRKASK